MEQARIGQLKDGTLADYQRVAESNGRSLEEELRNVIERNRPGMPKDCAALLRLSDEALAMTPPGGPAAASDSTLLIRWDRDTDHGRSIDDGWRDDDTGR